MNDWTDQDRHVEPDAAGGWRPAGGELEVDTQVPVDPVTETGEVLARGPSTTMEYQPAPATRFRGPTALRHRNFRLFWTGQLVSLIGTWMQGIAQSWLVLQLSNSAFALGLVTTLQFLPTLLFSLFGGVLADHLPRRPVLVVTQSSAMVLAAILGFLTMTGLVQVVHVMILAAALGFVNALDMPTRQVFVVDLVPREDLANAIALNSSVFNGARMIGPAVAGLVIGAIGLAGAFYLNALSFLPVIAGLVLITARGKRIQTPKATVWSNLREGLVYVRQTPVVWFTVVFVGIVSAFSLNLSILVPVLARDELRVGATGFGFLMSAMGLGSLGSALFLAAIRWRPRAELTVFSALAFGVFEGAVALVHSFVLAAVLLFLAGAAMVTFTTVANTVLQTTVPDPLRGRVMSVYTTVFIGSTPFASPLVGAAAAAWGVGLPLIVGGLAAVVVALASLWLRPWRP